MRLTGQCNRKSPISLAYVSKPLLTVQTIIQVRLSSKLRYNMGMVLLDARAYLLGLNRDRPLVN